MSDKRRRNCLCTHYCRKKKEFIESSGVFHRWGDVVDWLGESDEDGHLVTVAVVELDGGEVVTVPPNDIKFLN